MPSKSCSEDFDGLWRRKDGRGGSSYIDAVLLRDNDNGATWTQAASSSTRGGRLYYLQNWRADVVATVDSLGALVDQVRYSPYGVPTRLSIADLTAPGGTYNNGAVDFGPDGQITIEDFNTFLPAFGEESPVADIVGTGGLYGRDGQLTIEDFLTFLTAYGEDAGSTGRGLLARSDTPSGGNRRGYAGYEYAEELRFASRNVAVPAGASGATQLRPRAMYQVRHRVYDAEQGRWTRRDPLGYVDGMGLYEYVSSEPLIELDPSGLKPVRPAARPVPYIPHRSPTRTPDRERHRVKPLRLPYNPSYPYNPTKEDYPDMPQLEPGDRDTVEPSESMCLPDKGVWGKPASPSPIEFLPKPRLPEGLPLDTHDQSQIPEKCRVKSLDGLPALVATLQGNTDRYCSRFFLSKSAFSNPFEGLSPLQKDIQCDLIRECRNAKDNLNNWFIECGEYYLSPGENAREIRRHSENIGKTNHWWNQHCK